jgi:ligand-binding SRPBCC domain-containing protein
MRTGTRNGKRFLLSRTQIVPADLDDVFAFFKDPRNLAEITPLWLNFQVQWASDAAVREGTCVRYRIRWLGFPMRWESRIDRYVENVCFADEMVVGPYKSWYHLHRFRPVTDGVQMSDRVEYEVPLGTLGLAAHAVMVRRQLDAIFDYRTWRISAIFVGPHTSVGRSLCH